MRFIFDLDGTLTFDGKSIDNDIRAILLKAKDYGHDIGFVTARAYRATVKLLGDVLSKELVIGLNGGMAYNQGNLVLQHKLDRKAYEAVLKYAETYNLPYFVDNYINYATANEEHLGFIDLVDPLHIGKKLPAKNLEDPLKMVCYMGNHEDILADISYQLTSIDDVDVFYNDQTKYLHIGPSDVSKVSTLEELSEEPYIAFGDDKSDIAIFKEAIYSVQVGQYRYLTTYSDEQIPAQNEAVAQKIKELFETFKGK